MKLPSYGDAVVGIARAINDEIAEILREGKEKNQMREELAALIHDMWSGWIGHVEAKSALNPDGSMTIPAWAVMRRKRQMEGSYDDLSESEKDSDRREADKVLTLLLDYPREERNSELRDESDRMYAMRKKKKEG